MEMEGIKKLLSEVGKIRARVESYNQASGRCFNIFSITDIATDEVRICRVLYALLDPKGTHHQGAAFLKLFIENVLRSQRQFTEDEYSRAVVLREHSPRGETRRIDIFITIDGIDIPIEVKIYAGDQNEQCECYAKYASEGIPVYYLTPDGHEPADFSKGKLPPEKLELRSFADDILPWLDECLRLPPVIRIAPIRELLLQFQDTIREFTGTLENNMKKFIMEQIATPEALRSAIEISQVVSYMKEEMMNNIFQYIDNKINKKYNLDRYININDYDNKNRKSYPSISYKLSKWKDAHIFLRVEAQNGEFFVGLCVLNEKGKIIQKNYKLLQTEWIKGKWNSTENFPVWRYINLNNGRPNFNQHNEAFYSLWNEDKFKEFIEAAILLIDEMISSLNEKYKIN